VFAAQQSKTVPLIGGRSQGERQRAAGRRQLAAVSDQQAEGGGQQSAISHQPRGNRPDAAHTAWSPSQDQTGPGYSRARAESSGCTRIALAWRRWTSAIGAACGRHRPGPEQWPPNRSVSAPLRPRSLPGDIPERLPASPASPRRKERVHRLPGERRQGHHARMLAKRVAGGAWMEDHQAL